MLQDENIGSISTESQLTSDLSELDLGRKCVLEQLQKKEGNMLENLWARKLLLWKSWTENLDLVQLDIMHSFDSECLLLHGNSPQLKWTWGSRSHNGVILVNFNKITGWILMAAVLAIYHRKMRESAEVSLNIFLDYFHLDVLWTVNIQIYCNHIEALFNLSKFNIEKQKYEFESLRLVKK